MEFRKDIQLLRGLAVLIVVLFHLQIPFFINGFLGVDIFFVISGFLMAKLYDKGTIIEFYGKRLDRIFPAYAITILVILIVGYLLLIPVDFSQLFGQAISGIFFVSNVFYWNQNSYFDKAAFNPLLNLWSLAVEVQFYLIVPFLYPLIRTKKWLFIIIFFISAILCFAIQTISPKTSFFLMPLRIWEFLIGAWIAWHVGPKSDSTLYLKFAQISLFMVLVAFPFFIDLKPDAIETVAFGHPAVPALIVSLLTGFVIKFGLPNFFLNSFIGRSLIKIGDYSYSIYLVHFPIIVFFNYAPFGGTRLVIDNLGSLVIAGFLIASISTLSYSFIESKCSAFLNLFSHRIVLFLIILSSAFLLSNLNLNKYDEKEKNIFSAWTDRDVYRCGKFFRILNPFEAICQITIHTGDRRVLLLGNSHADSIKKVFSKVAFDNGFSTYFVVPNDPLLDSKLDSREIIKSAKKHKIDVICLHFSNVYGLAYIRNEILSLISMSKIEGIKVVVIGPVPTYDVHIPKAMYDGAGRGSKFSTNLVEHKMKTQDYLNFVGDLVKLNVAVYDPASFLCPTNGKCVFSTSESKPFYFDSAHLTLTGASILSPLFDESLKRLN